MQPRHLSGASYTVPHVTQGCLFQLLHPLGGDMFLSPYNEYICNVYMFNMCGRTQTEFPFQFKLYR